MSSKDRPRCRSARTRRSISRARGDDQRYGQQPCIGRCIGPHGPVCGGDQVLYTATADVPAGGSYPLPRRPRQEERGSIRSPTGHPEHLDARRVSDQYQVAMPVLTAAFSAPDMAGTAPQRHADAEQHGSVDAVVGIQITDDRGGVLHQTQAAAIPAGRTKYFNIRCSRR